MTKENLSSIVWLWDLTRDFDCAESWDRGNVLEISMRGIDNVHELAAMNA
ncbi:protein of unknown function [uncultured Woeseiaceae bacterium]|uniref:Uncharacterized protein n=1 Tax=uncultured Woeseiaceae bacterium TaxID=1983305 RepID=A0A7D9H4L8_9GAMM|nr:protein of unknown function [uncultured Woeseiaceae bacterium]